MAVSSKEKAESDAIQNLLVQLELVVDLLFMMDLSHLLTFISKEFQRFDVLPFYAMKMYWELKHHLNVARDSFNSMKIPDKTSLRAHGKSYVVWQTLENGVKAIIETQTFHNIQLLLRYER